MQAVAVFPEQRKVKTVRKSEPDSPGPGHVLLRVLEVGLCGTDDEIVATGSGTPPAGSDHLILGHESLAEVVEIGTDVPDFSPGDLVVPLVRRPCPHEHCVACRSGRQDFCYTGDYTERGIKQSHGFLAELVEDDARWLVAVPDTLRRFGVLVEPLSIAEKTLRQIHDIQERLPWACAGADPGSWNHRRRALVLGAGAIGLLGAMTLAQEGYETTIFSREPEGSDAARAAGTVGTYVCSEDVPLEDLKGKLGVVDVVYEATGAADFAVRALSFLSPNAVFALAGVPAGASRVEIDVAKLLRGLVLRNQVVFGTVNAPRAAYRAAVKKLATWIARWPDVLRILKSHHHALEEVPDLLRGDHPGIKHVVRVGA